MTASYLPQLATRLFSPEARLSPKDALLGLLTHLQHLHPHVTLHTGDAARLPGLFHPPVHYDAVLCARGAPRVALHLRAVAHPGAPLLSALPTPHIVAPSAAPMSRALLVLLGPSLYPLAGELVHSPPQRAAYDHRYALCPERPESIEQAVRALLHTAGPLLSREPAPQPAA